MKNNTIAAVSTGLTPSGIGIVRISGPESLVIADRVFRSGKRHFALKDAQTHTVHYGRIYDGEELIDDALVIVLRSPRSYTGEDTVEIDCHGGIFVIQRVLSAVIRAGARMAEPGEFTKRAFLNGKMDLSQAEAVMDVIGARNEFARRSAAAQLQGSVSREVKDLRSRILEECAAIEAALDDPEHLSLEGYPEQLSARIKHMIREIEDLLEKGKYGSLLSSGIPAAILGRPNAGKSSLLNALLGEERAIVTEIPGTTRDVLREEVRLGDVSLVLFDTAGIRESSDPVEKIGVERAGRAAMQAELILYVIDSSAPLTEEDKEIVSRYPEKAVIVIGSKSDLPPVLTGEDLKAAFGRPAVMISAVDGSGLEELKKEVEKIFLKGKISAEDLFVTNLRQQEMLSQALASLREVESSIDAGMTEEFFTPDLMDAYERLGEILGESLSDDLAEEIFSRFCMGK